jgi:hypothetical protein
MRFALFRPIERKASTEKRHAILMPHACCLLRPWEDSAIPAIANRRIVTISKSHKESAHDP